MSSHHITLRVDDDELRAMRSAAEAVELELSVWIRAVALAAVGLDPDEATRRRHAAQRARLDLVRARRWPKCQNVTVSEEP